MLRNWIILLLLPLFAITCQTQTRAPDTHAVHPQPDLEVSDSFVIAFGSCNIEDKPQPLWTDIMAQDPDLWIWLGDNIYADTENMAVMRAKYDKQNNHPAYRKFIEKVPMFGIWDDHDFGANNAGKEYPKKKESRDLMLKFLKVPATHPVWSREGGYQSYLIGSGGRKIKILMIDCRYFRDRRPPANASEEELATADILGEEQWAWLEEEMEPGEADLFLLCNGIQVLHEEHRYEKWANFPAARQRLLETIRSSGVKRVILLSGDRHLAEIQKIQLQGMDHPVYEITASGMTHSYESADEQNRYRVGKLVTQLNYGILRFSWENGLVISAELRGVDDTLYDEIKLY